MLLNRKNITKLNSWAAGIFGITGLKQDNALINIDLNTLILAGIMLIVTTIYILGYKIMKEKHQKHLTSKINRSI